MIVDRPDQYLGPDIFIKMNSIFNRPLFLKCEGFNFAWSIKLRTAFFMVEHAEKTGALDAKTTIIESSSGNLGVALSVIAASRSLKFVCVVDPTCSSQAVALMKTTGA